MAQPLMDRNAPEMEADEGKLSTPRQRLLAAVDLDGVIETEPRSPPSEGTPAWRTPARLAEALKSDDDAVDEVAVAQALARLQAKLREEQTSKAQPTAPTSEPTPSTATGKPTPPPPPENLEAAIAAHAASSVSLDAEEADVKAASTEMDGALASLQKWRAGREADRKALERKLEAEYSPPKLALDLDRTALAARTEEALSSARGARGRVEALLKAPRAEAPSANLPVFRRDGDAFREAADAELRELEANLARLQALHGDLEAWSDDDDDEEAKG